MPITACINADLKLYLNIGHTKTHGDRFSYRKPFPTPPIDHTKPLQWRLHRTTANLGFQQPNQNHKPPNTGTHNTHHNQHRFRFTVAKAAPQPMSSSSAPATAHSTIVTPPPLATNRAVEPIGDNHHFQQTTVVLAFSSHACAASTTPKEIEEKETEDGKIINLATLENPR
uniref:Uncharacterized protein n=1 Tax=Populus alba TaxID=43335 RepID=A0A4V6AAI7_POPAL|nr:hypothetical protein D5086_0000095130 [Populus alba]